MTFLDKAEVLSALTSSLANNAEFKVVKFFKIVSEAAIHSGWSVSVIGVCGEREEYQVGPVCTSRSILPQLGFSLPLERVSLNRVNVKSHCQN